MHEFEIYQRERSVTLAFFNFCGQTDGNIFLFLFVIIMKNVVNWTGLWFEIRKLDILCENYETLF